MKILDYKLIKNHDIDQFQVDIKKYTEDGYEIHGSPSVINYGNQFFCFQAVVKRDRSDQDLVKTLMENLLKVGKK